MHDGWPRQTQDHPKSSPWTFLPHLVQIGPAVSEEKIFKEIVDDTRRMMHDVRRTTLKAPLEHVVLRGAKNAGNKHFLLFQRGFLIYQDINHHFNYFSIAIYNCSQFGRV